MDRQPLILLTGASGYIGGRLLPLLEALPLRLRCMVRHPEFLGQRAGKDTEVVAGDVFDPESLEMALEGVHTAYYLVHSLAAGPDYDERDRTAARNFSAAALKAGTKQIVYLGGLAQGENLSTHLASRQEVGEILRQSGVPTIEFRASVVIGSGSLSFEMVRAMVERLPVMTAPRWVRTLAQPIAVEDVLDYLVQALYRPEPENVVYEIGGEDVSSYDGIMREYARQRGLRRLIIHLPVLTPRLSSHWLALVTPLYYTVGRQLIEGVKNESIVRDPKALKVFSVRPRPLSEAIRRALKKEDGEFAATHWSDALARSRYHGYHWGTVRFGTRLVDSYSRVLPFPPEKVFAPIQCVGGTNGWYALDFLWKLRGFLDRLVGGVGLRRGRRDPCDIRPGDAIDFWRVEKYEQDRTLVLFAEMKMPGRGWLHFEVNPRENGSEVRMTAIYDPVGVWGRAYWYMVYPLHFLIFNSMFKGIVKAVLRSEGRYKTVMISKKSAAGLALFLGMSVLAMVFGGLFTSPAIRSGWYGLLQKPSFNPPSWVFGPVWTVLYILMAISAWLVWERAGEASVKLPLSLFFIQLLLNVTWSVLFFGMGRPDLAFAEILLLWVLIFLVTVLFYRVRPAAGLLMIPYLAWVSFAIVLNGFIWRLNPVIHRL